MDAYFIFMVLLIQARKISNAEGSCLNDIPKSHYLYKIFAYLAS